MTAQAEELKKAIRIKMQSQASYGRHLTLLGRTLAGTQRLKVDVRSCQSHAADLNTDRMKEIEKELEGFEIEIRAMYAEFQMTMRIQCTTVENLLDELSPETEEDGT